MNVKELIEHLQAEVKNGMPEDTTVEVIHRSSSDVIIGSRWVYAEQEERFIFTLTYK